MRWLLFPVKLQAALFRTGADGTKIVFENDHAVFVAWLILVAPVGGAVVVHGVGKPHDTSSVSHMSNFRRPSS